MHDFNTFKQYMQTTFGANWLNTYKANPTSFQMMYFTTNNLGAQSSFEDFFKDFDYLIILDLGVKVDDISSVPQLMYSGTLFKTDAQVLKLAGKITELTGITLDSSRRILANMLNNKKLANQNPTFDKSMFQSALDEIFAHEEFVLDFELMNYKKLIGKNADGSEVYTTITHDILTNVVTTNENARALNNDVRPMAKELMGYIKYYNDNLKHQALSEIIENTKYNPAYEEFFPKFAKYVHETMNIAEDIDVFTVGLAQTYWLIKRLSRELPTYNDLMLTFRGEQGIGKSFILGSLFGGVLGKFYNSSAKVSDIIDERWTPALGNMLLVNIDEIDLGNGSKHMNGKSMAPLKARLTNTVFTYRPMGTNSVVEVKKKALFISTSNFHMYETMNDSSGMRRFLEFNSKNEKQQRFDHERTAKIAQLSLKAFQSIDENRDRGYWDLGSEAGKKISAIQETYVKIPLLNEFVAERLEYQDDMKFEDCIGFDRLYDDYCDYARDMGEKSDYLVTKRNFRSKMEDIIPNCTKMSARVYKFKFNYKKIFGYEERPSFTPVFSNHASIGNWDDL